MLIRPIAVLLKELLLLWRDRAGLLVLFVMPSVLVIVITLVQENVLKTIGAGHTRIVLIDEDGGGLGTSIEEKLAVHEGIRLVKTVDGQRLDRTAAINTVIDGRCQMAVIIPEGASAALTQRAETAMRRMLSLPPASKANEKTPTISIYFDPTVLGGFRSAMRSALELAAVEMEIHEQFRIFSDLLPERLEQNIRAEWGPYAPENLSLESTRLDLKWPDERLIAIDEAVSNDRKIDAIPTSVQQNVPAWALFGMFFIAVPIAGSLIRERLSGIDIRLISLPVSQMTLLMGKLVAFAVVCAVQFFLILLIGKFLLPVLGTPRLELGQSPAAILVMAASAVLAATGYGILLGTVGKTYEQVSMVGPITIVVAGALGGVMVPVYAMPEIMQAISVISPLGWGLNGFLDIFVRRGGIAAIVPEAAALFGFFAACLTVAGIFYVRRRH